jgi:hypothetical protein
MCRVYLPLWLSCSTRKALDLDTPRRQSIDRWENEGGSYAQYIADGEDAHEDYMIIRAGFNRWFSPWLDQNYRKPGQWPGYMTGSPLTHPVLSGSRLQRCP